MPVEQTQEVREDWWMREEVETWEAHRKREQIIKTDEMKVKQACRGNMPETNNDNSEEQKLSH